MSVMIATIGVVFGGIFKSPIQEYLPFLATGIVLWTFLSGVMNESCSSFIEAQGIVRQLPIPLFVHVLRVVWRNIVILGHNILIVPLVLLVMGRSLSWSMFWMVPGLILVIVCLSWIALLLAVICTRYRDMPQMVASILQVAFYLTPIIWMPSLLPGRAGAAVTAFNPFYHLIELIRAPLLGQVPGLLSWVVVLGLSIVGWLAVMWLYARVRLRVAYWL